MGGSRLRWHLNSNRGGQWGHGWGSFQAVCVRLVVTSVHWKQFGLGVCNTHTSCDVPRACTHITRRRAYRDYRAYRAVVKPRSGRLVHFGKRALVQGIR